MASSCKGGRITIEEFAKFLKLPVNPALEELFALFDRVRDMCMNSIVIVYMLHHCMSMNVKMAHHSSKIPIFLLTCNMFDAYGGKNMTHDKNLFIEDLQWSHCCLFDAV